MPGFNVRGLQADLEDGRMAKFKKSFGKFGGDFRFKTVYWNSLSDGAYDVRLLPKHPSKCPGGYVRLATHKVETKMGAAPVEVICTYVPGVEDAECFLCDILEAVQDELSSFDETIQKVMEQMAPRRKFIFPAVITMKADPEWKHSGATDDSGKPKKEYAPWVPDRDARQGSMLILEGKRVLDAFLDILKDPDYRDCNDEEEGYWLRVVKDGKEKPVVRPHKKPTPLDAKCRELMADKDYPSLHPVPEFMRKSTRQLNYSQQQTLVDGAWWKNEVLSDADDAPWEDDI